jgi:hypothetical protein
MKGKEEIKKFLQNINVNKLESRWKRKTGRRRNAQLEQKKLISTLDFISSFSVK